jgi:hypothetical protein
MAKKLDPAIAEVLKAYGFGPEAAWDCHGTWVVYHRVLEQIAAKARIKFDPPQVLEANGPAKSVAICVKGKLYGPEIGNTMAEEWSIGEAAPGNNKNSYPYAMAEKRAKDRVILKLIGLHGLAYSEDEADDFKASAPAPEAPKQAQPAAPKTPLPEGMEPAPDRPEVAEYLKKIAALLDVCDTNAEIDAALKEGAAYRKSIGLVEGSPSWAAFKSIVELGRQAVKEPA